MSAPSDEHILDCIAAYLGREDEWSGADACEYIANVIGLVRPHPGIGPGDEYAATFAAATGRRLPI